MRYPPRVLLRDASLVLVTLDPGETLPDALAGLPPGAHVAGSLSLTHVSLEDGRTFDEAHAIRVTAEVAPEGVDCEVVLLVDGDLVVGALSHARASGGVLQAYVPGLAATESVWDEDEDDVAYEDDASDDSPTSDEDGGEEELGWGDVAVASAKTTKDDSARKVWAEVAEAQKKSEAAPLLPRTAPFGDIEARKKRLARKRKKDLGTSKVPLFAKQPLPGSKPRQVPKEIDLDEPFPGEGDYIDHRQFGICLIERIDEEGAARILLPTKKRKQINLDIFDVSPPQLDEDGRVIFKVRPAKKGR